MPRLLLLCVAACLLGLVPGCRTAAPDGEKAPVAATPAAPALLALLPPEDNHRQKLLFAPDSYGKFDLNVRCILNLDGNLLFGRNGQPVAAYKPRRP